MDNPIRRAERRLWRLQRQQPWRHLRTSSQAPFSVCRPSSTAAPAHACAYPPKGALFTCPFGTHGTDLRTPMRADATDAQIAAIIRGVWSVRADRYSEQRASLTDELRARRKKVEMCRIDG